MLQSLARSLCFFAFCFAQKNTARDEARNKLEAAVQDRLNEGSGDDGAPSRRNSAFLPHAARQEIDPGARRREREDAAFRDDAGAAGGDGESQNHF